MQMKISMFVQSNIRLSWYILHNNNWNIKQHSYNQYYEFKYMYFFMKCHHNDWCIMYLHIMRHCDNKYKKFSPNDAIFLNQQK